MSKRPSRSAIIFQYSGLVIDCDSIDHCAAVEDENQWSVVVSFRASPKMTRIKAADREAAFVMVNQLKRGMIAAATGDYDILPPYPEEDDDDDEPATEQ